MARYEDNDGHDEPSGNENAIYIDLELSAFKYGRHKFLLPTSRVSGPDTLWRVRWTRLFDNFMGLVVLLAVA